MPDYEIHLTCLGRLDGKVVVRGAADEAEARARALEHARQARRWDGIYHTGGRVTEVRVTEVLPARGSYARRGEVD